MKLKSHNGSAHLWNEAGNLAVTCGWDETIQSHNEAAELAAEIARRVNAHEELVAAVKALMDYSGPCDRREMEVRQLARVALERAGF